MVWENLTLLQRWGIYGFILGSTAVFALLSQLRIRGVTLLSLRTRILLAIFFPIILLLMVAFGLFLIGVIALAALLLLLYLLFSRKRLVIKKI